MIEGLPAAYRRYEELSAQLSQPEAVADQARWRQMMKEYKELEPLSRHYLALCRAEEALAEHLAEQAGQQSKGAHYPVVRRSKISRTLSAGETVGADRQQ